MQRTQVHFTKHQLARLRTRADERGISVAALVREYIESGLSAKPVDRTDLYARAARQIGRFSDRHGAKDVARNHDRYLDEGFE